MYEKYLVSRV